MIGRENIEEKIFQYFEGELSADESLELEDFINNNPEYQIDFDAWKNSVVQDDQMKYKFVDELLVNERFSPKGWFKWASGGALFFGLVFASVVLMNKFDGGEDRLNALVAEKNNYINKSERSLAKNHTSDASGELQDKMSIATNERVVQKELNKNTLHKASIANTGDDLSLFKDATNQENSSSKNNLNDLVSSPSPHKKGFDINAINESSDFKDGILNSTLVSDELQSKKDVNINYISVEFAELKKYGYSKTTPVIKKSKYLYENPNTPKIFVTNNKDPYLNYALAHTIEENGSFVGNFNNGQGIRAEMMYRTEWPSVTSENFTSQIFSIDTRIDALKGGLGILVNADRIGHGKLNATAVSLIYSPKFITKNISIEPSFKYTYNQKSISWNQVGENDVKDPRNGVLHASIPFIPDDVIKTNMTHQDLGVGILINTNKLYFGGQIDHLNKASYTDDNFDQEIIIPFKMSAMIGTDIMKNKESQIRVSPSLNYIQYGVYNALWANAQVVYHGFFFAGGLATNEELMASLGYTNNKVRLVYGLGFSKPREFSGLPLTGGYYESHQLSLRVNLQPKK
ncbi:MAG: hypothetical protein CMD20_07330 [Flavobacteriales bacterium]|nr:hypothetical protein [Flavobacteriales bacterium]